MSIIFSFTLVLTKKLKKLKAFAKTQKYTISMLQWVRNKKDSSPKAEATI